MNQVKLSSGDIQFIPKSIYCYKSIKNSLESLCKNPAFESECKQWWEQLNDPTSNVLSDVFDGKIWRIFKRSEELFFTKKRNYGLMLNVDWVQPIKHLSSLSVGATYLVILNLPRYLCFKRKNVILVGVKLNMDKEPPTNNFLSPLVEKLDQAWTSCFNIKSVVFNNTELVHLALIYVSCDIAASRKICEFLGKTFFYPKYLFMMKKYCVLSKLSSFELCILQIGFECYKCVQPGKMFCPCKEKSLLCHHVIHNRNGLGYDHPIFYFVFGV